ncbi:MULTISPECIES: NUDIX hydrolase [Paenibacillus]|uniref:Nudix hydrolase domain-containing protein n=1 Tax=Paenibacillus albilobatus TaxID=2716884 RepID=A0A919XHL6_9BACL|nr:MULTISPECIES: NUDIX hydrolase [Paenibacillus]GIO30937.1 hypothetical protein J2TS6_20780 [Paenibacillus albilobatus]
MIRKAVGAIVEHDGKVMLVHKVKGAQGKIKAMWDFPKGGIEPQDVTLEQALFRELKEETGSTNYEIMKRYDDKILFLFDRATREKIGFERQETTMFHVVYRGDGTDLTPEDDEIDEIRFFARERIPELLFPESREFFAKHVSLS